LHKQIRLLRRYRASLTGLRCGASDFLAFVLDNALTLAALVLIMRAPWAIRCKTAVLPLI
jgi:hypothetical protein